MLFFLQVQPKEFPANRFCKVQCTKSVLKPLTASSSHTASADRLQGAVSPWLSA